MGFLGGLFGKKDKEPPKKAAAPVKPAVPIKKGTLPVKKGVTPLKKPVAPLKKPGGAAPAAAKPAAPAPKEEKPKMSDIDFLREQLKEIQDVMGAAEPSPAEAPASDKRGFLDVPLAKVLKVLPPEFVKPAAGEVPQVTVTVIVDELFDQLKSGRVSTPLKHIISEIPEEHLSLETQRHLEDAISLPLPLVVSSMEPGELKRRTASKNRELGVRGMPNVFSKEQLTAEAAESLKKAEEAAQQKPAKETAAPAPAEPAPAVEPVAEPEAAAAPAVEPETVAAPEPAAQEAVEEQPAPEEIPIPMEQPAVPEEPAREEVSAEDILKGLLEEAPAPAPETAAAEMGEVAAEEAAAPVEETAAAEEAPQEELLRELIEEPVAEEAPVEAQPAAEEAPVEEQAVAEGVPVEEAAPAEETATGVPVEEESPFASIMAELEQPAPAGEAVEQPVEEAAEAPVEEIPAAAAVPEPVPAAAAEVKEGQYLFLHGVDLNTASVEELMKLEGVTRPIAEKIVKARTETGQFFYLSDLMTVPGLGRKSFERITGQQVSSDTFRYADLIHEILGPPKHGIPNVKEVVQRFTALEDFEGCIITHADGYTMASSWDNPKEEALGAFTPQMFKKVASYISQLDMGALSSITFTLEQQPLTIICSGSIFLIAIHVPNRFNKRSVSIAQAIGAEIGRRLTSARDKEE